MTSRAKCYGPPPSVAVARARVGGAGGSVTYLADLHVNKIARYLLRNWTWNLHKDAASMFRHRRLPAWCYNRIVYVRRLEKWAFHLEMPASVVASLFLDIEIVLNMFEGTGGEHAGVVTQPDPKTECDPPRPELRLDNGYGNLFASRGRSIRTQHTTVTRLTCSRANRIALHFIIYLFNVLP